MIIKPDTKIKCKYCNSVFTFTKETIQNCLNAYNICDCQYIAIEFIRKGNNYKIDKLSYLLENNKNKYLLGYTDKQWYLMPHNNEDLKSSLQIKLSIKKSLVSNKEYLLNLIKNEITAFELLN